MTKLVIFGDSDLEGIKSILRRARLGKMIRTAEIGLKQQPTIEGFINDQISRSYVYRFFPIVAEFREPSKDKPQITVKEGNQNDNTKRNYIYDSENNKLGIILESKLEKKKKNFEHILFPRIKKPNYNKIMAPLYKFITVLTPEFYTKLHTGNVLLLNINGNKDLYFVIDDIEEGICYCVKHDLVLEIIEEKLPGPLKTITSEESYSLIQSEELDEIPIDNSNNAMFNEINKYLSSNESQSVKPDSVGFGRMKESRKKDRRKAKPSPKGKPKGKPQTKPTKKKKKVKRKTK